jgi:hypothetical protein
MNIKSVSYIIANVTMSQGMARFRWSFCMDRELGSTPMHQNGGDAVWCAKDSSRQPRNADKQAARFLNA